MKKIKMIALDLDGTLTTTKKDISKKTYEALMQAQKAGVIVVLASGRPEYGMKDLAEELKLSEYGGYVLAFNGAKIINWKTKEVVFSEPVPSDAYAKIYEVCKSRDLPLLAHEDDHLIAEKPEDRYIVEEARINHMAIQKIDAFETYTLGTPYYKFIATGDGDELAKIEADVREALNDACDVYRSAAFFLEIVAKNIDKADSLSKLLKIVGLNREDLVACGDGFNDIHMIEYAGFGVAMANAEDAVKKAADYITLSNDEDGIADLFGKVITYDGMEEAV